MSHFYGIITGNRGHATRGGSKASGYKATAATWKGAINVDFWHNKETGEDCFRVEMTPWHGRGDSQVIAQGIVGDKNSIVYKSAAFKPSSYKK